DDTRVSAVMGTAIDDLGKALDNVTEFRTQTGARLNSLDSQHDQNEAYELQIQSTLSQLRDLDYVEAIGQLQFQMFALEAAQASFARIEGNSLFNYLR
ncbi:MAG TPA: flagellar hook-associated protein 3, partial [Gammaproteobacteria bacterium]|nr:flagellar hook-associated protein 3 [Gammaproteobacteria bacterium]